MYCKNIIDLITAVIEKSRKQQCTHTKNQRTKLNNSGTATNKRPTIATNLRQFHSVLFNTAYSPKKSNAVLSFPLPVFYLLYWMFGHLEYVFISCLHTVTCRVHHKSQI